MLSAGNANLLNAITLIGMGFWGFQATQSKTAFIPVLFGVVLMVLTNSIRAHSKVVAHIAVVLTLLMLLALLGMRLPKGLESGGPGLYRTIAMIITGIIALAAFVKSFIDAKKAKGNVQK